MTFGEKLRTLRLKANINQKELAKKAGLGLNTISNYENGKTYPQNREVYNILGNILGVSGTELRNENDDFIITSKELYGHNGKKRAEKLVEEIGGLFVGGELSEKDIDSVMKTLQDYYWKAKEDNKKYTSKTSKK